MEKQYKMCIKVCIARASGHFDQEGTMDQWTSRPAEPIVLSLEQSVPGGNKGGWVEGTDEDEQQKVEAHHDGKMMSEKPRGAAGMSEEKEQRLKKYRKKNNWIIFIFIIQGFSVLLFYE